MEILSAQLDTTSADFHIRCCGHFELGIGISCCDLNFGANFAPESGTSMVFETRAVIEEDKNCAVCTDLQIVNVHDLLLRF